MAPVDEAGRADWFSPQSSLSAYRQMTIDEAETGDAGDRQIEIEHEVWNLEQDLHARKPVPRAA